MPETLTLNQAIDLLKKGEVVALPTETVYGLAADISNAEAIKKIFSTKNRPFFDPLIVHVHSIEQSKSLVKAWPKAADQLAKAFWPGPLTLVLEKNDSVSSMITSGQPTVALRMPNHPLFLEVLRGLKSPLAAPSANRFGKTSPTTFQHVKSEFNNTVKVLDGGPCQIGIESTIVEIKNDKLIILRPGIISGPELQKVTGLETIDGTKKSKQAGHLAFHYQPDTTFVIFDENVTVADYRLIDKVSPHDHAVELKLNHDPVIAARELYAKLRELSERKASYLYFQLKDFHLSLAWSAIYDRVEKASHLIVKNDNGKIRVLKKHSDAGPI